MHIARWPWEEVPRASFAMSGDIDGVVASGLMSDVASVHRYSSLICAGIPDDESCEAKWTCPSSTHIVVAVRSPSARYVQTFIRQEAAWVVVQNLLVLSERYRSKGYAKRLGRNLVIEYDRLGIIHASTIANDVGGGYVWAALGARALDPELQRQLMLEKLEKLMIQGQITRQYAQAFISQISEIDDDDLMHWISQQYVEAGGDIGRLLLLGHCWDAYWDLSDIRIRNCLRDVLQ